MSQTKDNSLSAKDALAIIGTILWASLSSAFLAASICLTIFIHSPHNSWPIGIFLSGMSLFIGWMILIASLVDD